MRLMLLLIAAMAVAVAWGLYRASRRWGVFAVACVTASAVAWMHAAADLTGLLNFGHHPPQHAWMALSEGVLFGVLGCSDLRKRMGRRA